MAQAKPEKASQLCLYVARASFSCNWWPGDSLGAGQSSAQAVGWRMQHVMLHSGTRAIQSATWANPQAIMQRECCF